MTATTGRDGAQYVIGGDGELRVRLHAGELRLRGVDGDTVRVRDLEGRDLGERLVMDEAEGRLSIRPRERTLLDLGWATALAGLGRGIELAIDVPAGAAISVDTASADVEAVGTRGPQRYRTASGEVTLTDVSGDITADAVSGDVSIGVAGDATITGRTVSGEVELRGGAVRSMDVVTTSGDVDIDTHLGGHGPFAIQTVSGDATVATDRGLTVTAKTVTGDITADGSRRSEGRGEHVITVADGAIPLSFRSISGDLRIAQNSAPRRRSNGAIARTTEATPVVRAATASKLDTATESDTATDTATESDTAEDAGVRNTERLAILRELEAGTIDIDAASARLAALDEAES